MNEYLPNLSKKKKIIFFLIYIVVLSFFFMITLEIVLRIRNKQRFGFDETTIDQIFKLNEELGIRIPVHNLNLKGSKTHIKINSIGFRGEEFASIEDYDIIRISFLGGSTTFCSEVSNNDSTWPELVGSFLKAKFPNTRFEIINASVPGYGIEESFVNLKYRVLPLKPDIIILYHATNDISFTSKWAAIDLGILKGSNTYHQSYIAEILSKYSITFDLFYKNIKIYLRQRIKEDFNKLNYYPIQYSNKFVAILDSINSECSKNEVSFHLFTFSTKFRKNQFEDEYIKNMNTSLYYMPWMSPSTIFEAFEIFNKKMRDYAINAPNVYIDTLHNIIPGNDTYFIDSVHFTNKGARLMAKRVFNSMIKNKIIENTIRRKVKAH